MPRSLVVSLLLTLTLVVGGCEGPTLSPTPYVIVGAPGVAAFAAVDPSLQVPNIPIVYFTDRADERAEGAPDPVYGASRSADVSFGVATVSLTPAPSWAELVEASTALERQRKYQVHVSSVEQKGGIPSLKGRLRAVDGQLVYPEASSEAFLQNLADFEACLEPWLDDGDDNGAIVFVHGFNNTFDDAVIRLARTWHATGRDGVPILYTWPAGFDAFAPVAYNHDRESGEFTVLHLKTLLMALAMNDRIDRIHIVAHSRGAAVVTTALREIHSEVWAASGRTVFGRLAQGFEPYEPIELPWPEREPSDVLKLETLMLVAPDLDLEVFAQRFLSERILSVAKRLIVYSSARDRAIRISDFFYASDRRLGAARMEDFDETVRPLIAGLPSLEIVECRVKARSSHAYLFDHPATLSDIVLVMRDGRPAGAEHGRPLEPLGPGFWLLRDDYLRPAADPDTE